MVASGYFVGLPVGVRILVYKQCCISCLFTWLDDGSGLGGLKLSQERDGRPIVNKNCNLQLLYENSSCAINSTTVYQDYSVVYNFSHRFEDE
jgi:hypothetical protein